MLNSVNEEAGSCPNCRAPRKEQRSFKMFGDNWKTVCMKCGHVLAEGCGDVPEGCS
jgi:uncharacterized Zn finger protein